MFLYAYRHTIISLSLRLYLLTTSKIIPRVINTDDDRSMFYVSGCCIEKGQLELNVCISYFVLWKSNNKNNRSSCKSNQDNRYHLATIQRQYNVLQQLGRINQQGISIAEQISPCIYYDEISIFAKSKQHTNEKVDGILTWSHYTNPVKNNNFELINIRLRLKNNSPLRGINSPTVSQSHKYFD